MKVFDSLAEVRRFLLKYPGQRLARFEKALPGGESTAEELSCPIAERNEPWTL